MPPASLQRLGWFGWAGGGYRAAGWKSTFAGFRGDVVRFTFARMWMQVTFK